MLLQESNENRHNELKQEVKTTLLSAVNNPFQEMDLVDKIQKLGVGYHFRKEIEDILQRSYNDKIYVEDDHADLYYISLRFRLLRQAGYFVSPGNSHLHRYSILLQIHRP